MNKLNVNRKFSMQCCGGVFAFTLFSLCAAKPFEMKGGTPLSFTQTIKIAQKNDPWLTGNVHKQKAIESMSIAVNTLPDQKISIGLASLPINGFDFGQEGMTQIKVGISQLFPRGDTLAIKGQQLKIKSEAFPYQRKDRQSKVAVTVGSLWLDAYGVQQSIALIEKNRLLFVQLADVATASYSSALGKTRQQDIVRAQLELTHLEDRLDKLALQKNHYDGMLSQWLVVLPSTNSQTNEADFPTDFSLDNITIGKKLPKIGLLNRDLVFNSKEFKTAKLLSYFATHPAVIAIDKQVDAGKTGIKLAKQKYKAAWEVNASYGYRENDPVGRSRADLFSLGVTFDLPLFTKNRQDQEVQSAISQTAAIKTEKLLLLRQLFASYSSAKGRILRLIERQDLYKTKLLPQIHDQAEASLAAYTNDDGDFSEVVRSRIAVLNAEIDDLTLKVAEQKLRLELNYLFIGGANTSVIKNKQHNANKMNLIDSNQYAVIAGEK